MTNIKTCGIIYSIRKFRFLNIFVFGGFFVGEEVNNAGCVKISEDVIAGIANTAACEINGVVKLVSKGIAGAKSMIPNFKTAAKGVSIASTEDGMDFVLNIAVKPGVNIQRTAEAVQKNVIEAVQNMTGIKVNKVNVFVVSLVSVQNEGTSTEE